MLSVRSLRDQVRGTIERLVSVGGASPVLTITPAIASSWAAVYHMYALAAQAGPLLPTPSTLRRDLISAGMLSEPSDFAAGLSAGLESYWLSASFFGQGFIPINPCTPGTYARSLVDPGLRSLGNLESRDDGASQIANVLHTYTMGIRVTSTTLPPASSVNVAVRMG